MELNRTQAAESRDLVADMARAIEAPAVDVAEAAPAAAQGAGTDATNPLATSNQSADRLP